MPKSGDTIKATVQGRTVQGSFQAEDQASTGQRRWTVRHANDVLSYLFPDAADTEIEVGQDEDNAASNGEVPKGDGPVRMQSEAEVDIPTYDLKASVLPDQKQAVERAVEAPAPVRVAEPTPSDPRFAVKRKGTKFGSRSYHLYEDCGHVSVDDDTDIIPVSDDLITFFDLTVCKFCDKRASRLGNLDALLEAAARQGVKMTLAQAQSLSDDLREQGFKLTPEYVDRSVASPTV